MTECPGPGVAPEQCQEVLRAAVVVVVPARHGAVSHFAVQPEEFVLRDVTGFEKWLATPQDPVDLHQAAVVGVGMMPLLARQQFVDVVCRTGAVVELVQLWQQRRVVAAARVQLEEFRLVRVERKNVVGQPAQERHFPPFEGHRLEAVVGEELGDFLAILQARALCKEGLRLADPARFDLRGELAFGRDVEIDVNVVIEGRVTLGNGVRIGPFVRIRDCHLASGTEVLAHCDLDGVTTHGHCRIGPFARLRPGTELDTGAHVGNFVETKKARIGKGSKANHLSYIGDAVVGTNVNIGAGTITCNYDGVNKFETHIGDGAFIGSNSALVAPVTIGAGATIGAGSTLSKDAPDGELTVARAKQITVKGWKRPTRRV